MEGLNQRVSLDILHLAPHVLARVVALPLDIVLQLILEDTTVKDLLDLIDHSARRQNVRWRLSGMGTSGDGVRLKAPKPTDMEDRMDEE